MTFILSKKEGQGQWQRNSHGFSLVEVMVVAAILGGLSFYAMQLIDGQRRAQKGMDSRFEASSVTAEVLSILNSSENCRETFKGIDLASFISSGNPLPIASFRKKRTLPDGEVLFMETHTISPESENRKS